MNEKLEDAIVAILKEQGYKNVEGNLGNIWYEDDEGQTWCISANICG